MIDPAQYVCRYYAASVGRLLLALILLLATAAVIIAGMRINAHAEPYTVGQRLEMHSYDIRRIKEKISEFDARRGQRDLQLQTIERTQQIQADQIAQLQGAGVTLIGLLLLPVIGALVGGVIRSKDGRKGDAE